MKLQLFISHNGGVSRRKAFDHVLAGDVTVNGLVIREPSHMIEPTEDKVALLGNDIKPKPYEYIMLNKPAGVVTTCEAQFDQRAVIALLPPNLRHLKPVGRLDKDTEGLLLLTNDGEMANRLAHPSFDVNKTYHVKVNRRMEFREKDRLEQGVVIDKFRTAPAEVANMQFHSGSTEFDLTIHEGHKHQVRLMCHEVGHDVIHLTRIAQGPLKLGTLKVGAMRPLTGEELALLHVIARPETGRSPRITPKPLFKSNSTERRYSANRDWHSDKSTRRILSGTTGSPRRADKPRAEGYARRDDRPRTESAPRREYKPYSRDARPGSDRPRTEDAPRREYKPYSRDARPGSDRPRSARPSSGKPFASSPKPYKKSFGKKTFRKSV